MIKNLNAAMTRHQEPTEKGRRLVQLQLSIIKVLHPDSIFDLRLSCLSRPMVSFPLTGYGT